MLYPYKGANLVRKVSMVLPLVVSDDLIKWFHMIQSNVCSVFIHHLVALACNVNPWFLENGCTKVSPGKIPQFLNFRLVKVNYCSLCDLIGQGSIIIEVLHLKAHRDHAHRLNKRLYRLHAKYILISLFYRHKYREVISSACPMSRMALITARITIIFDIIDIQSTPSIALCGRFFESEIFFNLPPSFDWNHELQKLATFVDCRWFCLLYV